MIFWLVNDCTTFSCCYWDFFQFCITRCFMRWFFELFVMNISNQNILVHPSSLHSITVCSSSTSLHLFLFVLLQDVEFFISWWYMYLLTKQYIYLENFQHCYFQDLSLWATCILPDNFVCLIVEKLFMIVEVPFSLGS